jgi:hypothetical protein
MQQFIMFHKNSNIINTSLNKQIYLLNYSKEIEHNLNKHYRLLTTVIAYLSQFLISLQI